jgi:hypothetical protein
MSRQVAELEVVLRSLISEHQRLVRDLDAQQAAMKALDLTAMERARQQQESVRLRIATLESRRRLLVVQIARSVGLAGEPRLGRLAELIPARATQLLALREQLRRIIEQVTQRTTIAGRLAGAVLGHLNTAVRLFAGAVDDGGTYTKHGVTTVTRRIGVIEAVG